jgi:translation initiation factor 1 (eIF-1/SUI1)
MPHFADPAKNLLSFEIQGDHCDALIAALTKMGCRPKRSGA